MSRFLLVAALVCLHAARLPASQITGSIVVDPKTVRRSLPPAVYDLRGVAVPDHPNSATDSRGFGRVAVWLEGDSSPASAAISATMQQRNRRFEPDLLIIPARSRVAFPNLDPIFHNIFSLSRTQPFDLGYYSDGKSRDVVFPHEGIVQVYCHVHPEMYGVVVVTSSRWTAKPASDGSFSWPDVPPGKYRLIVWQRSAGLVHKAVTVPETGSVQVTIRLPEEDSDK